MLFILLVFQLDSYARDIHDVRYKFPSCIHVTYEAPKEHAFNGDNTAVLFQIILAGAMIEKVKFCPCIVEKSSIYLVSQPLD